MTNRTTKVIRGILKQYNLMPSWIGGVEITFRELMGTVIIFTYVGVALNAWQDNTVIHPYFFGNFFIFLFSIIPLILFGGLLYYKFFIHAKQKYLQHQVFRIERSPLARKLFEHDEVLKEMCKAMGIDYEKAIRRVRPKKKG